MVAVGRSQRAHSRGGVNGNGRVVFAIGTCGVGSRRPAAVLLFALVVLTTGGNEASQGEEWKNGSNHCVGVLSDREMYMICN